MTDSEKLAVAMDVLEMLEPYARACLKECNRRGEDYTRRWFVAWQQSLTTIQALDQIRADNAEQLDLGI